MARLSHDFENMLESYYDILELEDYANEVGNSFSEEGSETGKLMTDTLAADLRDGKDIQGIPWDRFGFRREEYRGMRLRQYKNYESLSRSHDELEKLFQQGCKHVEGWRNFYDFRYNTRLAKSTIVHFQ